MVTFYWKWPAQGPALCQLYRHTFVPYRFCRREPSLRHWSTTRQKKTPPPPSPPGARCPVMSVYTEFRSRMHTALKITSSVTARRPFVSLPASLCDANRRLLATQTFTTSVDLARKLAVKWTVRRNKFATSIVAIAFTYNTRGGDYRGTGGDTSPQHFGWGTQR